MTHRFILDEQRHFFHSGVTLDYTFRIKQLKKLKDMIQSNEKQFISALEKDFNKPPFETYISEIQMTYDEINYLIKNLKRLMKPEKVRTPLVNFYSISKIFKEPLGSILIISPWNYPITLALTPLAGAIAAGNCAVLKPSEISSHTSQLLHKLISSTFSPNYIRVVEGGADTTQNLIKLGFNHCFFTGSTAVGKEVMKTASETLTPVTLELGGKSPCIVAEDADLVKAAARIVWGKFLNAGQTCIAPDYLLVHESVRDELIRLIKEVIERFYQNQPLNNPDYPGIINEKHFNRLNKLMTGHTIIYGGHSNYQSLKIHPTLILEPAMDSDIMNEEIFGPLLPIITYSDINKVVSSLKKRDKPLALYLFTQSKETKNYVMKNVSFGNGAINDTMIQFANINMPFGGVGMSGMGHYHGKYSFYTFSHQKSVSEKSNLFDIPIRYAPYNDKLMTIIKKTLGR